MNKTERCKQVVENVRDKTKICTNQELQVIIIRFKRIFPLCSPEGQPILPNCPCCQRFAVCYTATSLTPRLFSNLNWCNIQVKKIRELIQRLTKTGFVDREGKGSHHNFTHPGGAKITIDQKERLKNPDSIADIKAQKLMSLKGVGPVSAWVLGKEFFGWRNFRNRKEVGALAGLTGTPYSSGDSNRDLGISKSGSRSVRCTCVELAWCWTRFQPESELTKWFMERFGKGGKRMRKIGIVALARKLLIALWKYIEKDELPAGAVLSV